MSDPESRGTFRDLPLTEEQDAEIRHYIKRKHQRGEVADPKELAAMIEDMLNPPSQEENGASPLSEDARADAERAGAAIDEQTDAGGASEERQAAMEAEAMKRGST